MLTFVVLNVTQCRLHEALELVGVYVAEALLVKDTEGLLDALVRRPLVGGLRQVQANDLLELRPRDDGVLVVVCNARQEARAGRWTSQRLRGPYQQIHTTGGNKPVLSSLDEHTYAQVHTHTMQPEVAR